MSRKIIFEQAGGPEVLQTRDVEAPAPGSHEVRIAVKAIGLNRAEAMWRQDAYIEPVRYPAALGYEAAGLVDAVGADIRGFAVGDAVNVIPSFSMNDYGTYGDLVLVPDYAVVKQPEGLTSVEAASIWMMFVTAYGALIEDAKVGPGDVVLIPAASSSVGLAAIQLAAFAGAVPVALTRTSAKHQRLLEAGAHHVIATEETDLVAEVMRITEGKGARVVFDPVGGPTFPKLVAALGVQGRIYLYGALSDEPTPLPVLDMIAKMPTLKAHNIWETSGDAARRGARRRWPTRGQPGVPVRPDGRGAPVSGDQRPVREGRRHRPVTG